MLDWMQLFGMMPVVPAFGGHVPDGLLRFYPKLMLQGLQVRTNSIQ